MNEELNISLIAYSRLLEQVGVAEIYNFITTYGTHSLAIYYYIDEHRRFNPPKTNSDKIAKAIFDEMNSSDKMKVLQYLEDLDDGLI